ncbi:hypothetical protein EVAR_66145_1 [Eumeta japonica]|uniref:Uncharacterized protein n=1 Tax=Eumeta variegata TaxID=151549 RepID=A0A4C1Z0L7_EUMVA|nr:hypothetical protein EVAR_66145_1 [Eumeta japonica]
MLAELRTCLRGPATREKGQNNTTSQTDSFSGGTESVDLTHVKDPSCDSPVVKVELDAFWFEGGGVRSLHEPPRFGKRSLYKNDPMFVQNGRTRAFARKKSPVPRASDAIRCGLA